MYISTCVSIYRNTEIDIFLDVNVYYRLYRDITMYDGYKYQYVHHIYTNTKI